MCTGTAGQLLRGSRNLDNMRESVEQMLGIVAGFLRMYPQEKMKGDVNAHGECKIDAPSFVWEVRFWYEGHWVAAISIGYGVVYNTDRGMVIKPKMPFMQRYYEGLSALVDGVAKAFPGIEEVWKPVIEASKVEV